MMKNRLRSPTAKSWNCGKVALGKQMSQTIETLRNLQNEILALYRDTVLTGPVRYIDLLGRKHEPRILQTFLGFELQMGRRRLPCPDMVTARYLRVFAELGLPRIALPYRPTTTANLLPRLEGLFADFRKAAESGPGAVKAYAQLRKKLLALPQPDGPE